MVNKEPARLRLNENSSPEASIVDPVPTQAGELAAQPELKRILGQGRILASPEGSRVSCSAAASLPGHGFDQIRRANAIEHGLTKPNHPWTNGQVERMNRP